MKLSRRKLAKGIYIAYSLSKNNGEYTISCIEENTFENKTSFFRVDNITPIRKKANKIFRIIIKHKVFGETLLDVIYNLISEY